MQIQFSSSVKTPAGWRDVSVVAEATQVSPAMAVVSKVVLLDGEAPNRSQSRTGAKRQAFDGTYFAGRLLGAKKRLSACSVIATTASA